MTGSTAPQRPEQQPPRTQPQAPLPQTGRKRPPERPAGQIFTDFASI